MVVDPIKIAVLAMGGEGGGVLADWIVDLAEGNGWFAQTTSVPGVAQRTGATIYYIELFPGADDPKAKQPVFVESPLPGDVDIVIASELMEAGRALKRGFVSADRTTVISSTHRVYTKREKMEMSDGRIDSDALLKQVETAAKRYIRFDMAKLAGDAGAVVSACMFGALCGAGVLPFTRKQFEDTIVKGGKGVKSSLKAFDLAFSRAQDAKGSASGPAGKREIDETAPQGLKSDSAAVEKLLERVRGYPEDLQWVLTEGLRKVIDYQDTAYGKLYMDRMDALAAARGGKDVQLLHETARYLALWMAYDDTFRVADLKTRGSRFQRVRDEVHAHPDQVLTIGEYMHPRIEEICDTMPSWLGRWILKPNFAHRFVRLFTLKGRVIKTTSLTGFLMLYMMARFGYRFRRISLRYKIETRQIDAWLERLRKLAAVDPALALEAAKCQRLIKGYSNTHARGLMNFNTIMKVIDQNANHLAPAQLAEMRNAALGDERGKKLFECLQRNGFSVDGLFTDPEHHRHGLYPAPSA